MLSVKSGETAGDFTPFRNTTDTAPSLVRNLNFSLYFDLYRIFLTFYDSILTVLWNIPDVENISFIISRKQLINFEIWKWIIHLLPSLLYKGLPSNERKIFKTSFFQNSEILKISFLYFNRCRRGLKTCPQAKASKSGHAIFFSFFPTRPSDEYDSAPSRKYSRPLLDVFACIG